MVTILTVDDSASMRQMMSLTLKRAGYDVTEAVDGLDALEKAGATKFDLVISEVKMSTMDGNSLIKELRTHPNFKLTPMLIVTSEKESDKQLQDKIVDASGWIVKPFNTKQLLATINKHLTSQTKWVN